MYRWAQNSPGRKRFFWLLQLLLEFFLFLRLFGFPIFKAKSDIVDDNAVVIIKDVEDGSCIVEASDKIPRSILECPNGEGDVITITYTEGSDQIKDHKP